MKNKKFSVLLTIIFCSMVAQVGAQAQDAAPPDTSWDADPLDVLEPKKPREVVEPTVPEFTEIPEPGKEPAKKPKTVAPVATPHEVAAPAPAPSAPVGSDPDFSKEAEFNRIYKKYNEQPTSEEAWEKASGKRKAETYQVQKGNTLWDISNTFFGDPNFWPKIWSFNNGSIGNPHEIDPSMSIRFFAGDMSDAPTVELTENKGAKDAIVDASKTADATEAAVPAPARKKKASPVLSQLPESLPSRKIGIVLGEKPKVEVQIMPRAQGKGLEYLGYYLTETPITGVGVVTATEMDLKAVGDFVYIYVRLDHPDGKNFVVQKNFAQVEDPRQKGRKANMVEIQGQIEILAPVNSQKNIYRALVKKTIAPVEVGSLLLPGELPMIDPANAPISSSVGARIIGGQYGANRTMFGANSLVFLDAGTRQGLTEGASLGIFADEGVRTKGSDAVINDRQIGVVKIIKVTDNFATAYVTKSTDDIRKGDYVGEVVKTALAAPEVAEPVKTEPSGDKSSPGDLEKEFELDNTPTSPAAPSDSGADDSDLTL